MKIYLCFFRRDQRTGIWPSNLKY